MKSSEKFMNRIKEENIKPKPKWWFAYKNIIIWLLVLLSAILGAMAFSVVLFTIQQIEFNLISHMSHSKFELWLGLLPFLWIISLVIFVFIAIFGLKNTRKGYKISITGLVTISTVLSILLGTLFFIGGGAKWLENSFAVNVGFYEGVNEKKVKMWSIPEDGYLSGVILKIDEGSLQLKDFADKTWNIDIREAEIFNMVQMEEGEMIKLTGKMTDPNKFSADQIRPWGGFGQRGQGKGRSGKQ